MINIQRLISSSIISNSIFTRKQELNAPYPLQHKDKQTSECLCFPLTCNPHLLISIIILSLVITLKMNRKESLGDELRPSPKLRQKAQSYMQTKVTNQLVSFTHLEYFALSSSMDLSQHTKRFSLQNLLEYIHDALEKIYEKDELNLKQTFSDFLNSRLVDLRCKVQQRLSLLNYLEQSLKYKSFSEIELQIHKQWKKNVLLFSISIIWSRCMLVHEFKTVSEFLAQYEKYRNFVANLTQFYFKNSLKILNSKNVETLTLLYQDSAHQIINNFKDWKEIYESKLLSLIEREGKEAEKGSDLLGLDFDLKHLRVNEHYLNVQEQENQLKETTKYIHALAQEYKIHQKIAILKKIRANFLAEITENSNKIKEQLQLTHVSQLEKDDILDCMIYCIVKGGIYNIGNSLKALVLLLGKDSDLLSKRGVDSYRADLQGAIQYLVQQRVGRRVLSLTNTDL